MRAVPGVVVAAIAAAIFWTGSESHRRGWFRSAPTHAAMPIHLAGMSDAAGRTERPCGIGEVIVVFGQSNADNRGRALVKGDPEHFVSKRGALNFNIFDGKCYLAKDPMLGGTGGGASPWPLFGDILIERGQKSVTITLAAVGGSRVSDWANGRLAPRIDFVFSQLAKSGLKPTRILWHQGEHDAIESTTKPEYVASFTTLANSIRRYTNAPIYVAIASICRNLGSEDVRAAQRALPTLLPGVKAGPNTDQFVSLTERPDGCHFSTRVLPTIAKMWADSLSLSKSCMARPAPSFPRLLQHLTRESPPSNRSGCHRCRRHGGQSQER